MLDSDFEDDMNKLYGDFMTEMMTNQEIHPAQRAFFRLLFEDHADCFGAKRRIYVQLVESGLQLERGLSAPMEFLMFDKEKYEASWREAVQEKDALLEALSPLVEWLQSNPEHTLDIFAISSWATGFVNTVSCAVEIEKRIVGKDNRCDTLPEPAVPNAKNAKDGFSTDFTAEQLEEGCKIVHAQIDALLQKPAAVDLIDTNKLLDKVEDFRSIHSLMINRGFRVKRKSPNGETYCYVCRKSKLHYAIVHYPFSFAGDSRVSVSNVARVRRGMTVTTITLLVDELLGKPALGMNDAKGNPHFAMHVFQIAKTGFQAFLQIATLYYKHIVAANTQNVMATTTQRHLPFSKTVPVSRRVRCPKEAETDRSNNQLLMIQARSIVSRAQSDAPDAMLRLYKELEFLFSRASAKTKCARWKSFLEKSILPNSNFLHLLKTTRDANIPNLGNRTKNRIVHNMAANNAERDEEVDDIIHNHAPANGGEDGSLFWMYFGDVGDTNKPERDSKVLFGNMLFPGPYPVYTTNSWSSLKVKLRRTNYSLNGTEAAWRKPVIACHPSEPRDLEGKRIGWKLGFLHKKDVQDKKRDKKPRRLNIL